SGCRGALSGAIPECGARSGVLRRAATQPLTSGRRRKAALRALRPGREELRCNRAEPAEAKVEAGSGERSAAPEPKIATVRAPGGGRLPYGDARRLARGLACPDSAGPTDASQASVRLSALRHPETRVGEAKKTKPGRKTAPRERERLCEWGVKVPCEMMRYERACGRRYCALAPLAGRGQLGARPTKDWVRGTRRNRAPHPTPLPARLARGAREPTECAARRNASSGFVLAEASLTSPSRIHRFRALSPRAETRTSRPVREAGGHRPTARCALGRHRCLELRRV